MNTVICKIALYTALGLLPGAFAYGVEQPWVQEAIPAKTFKTPNKEKSTTGLASLGYIANLQGNVGKIGNALAIIGHCEAGSFIEAERELLAQIETLSSSSALYKKTIIGDIYGALNESKKLLKVANEKERSVACQHALTASRLWNQARQGRYGEQLMGSSLVDLTISVVDSEGNFTLGDPTGPAFAPRKPKREGPEPGVDREYF